MLELDEMFQQNASQFAILLECENPCVVCALPPFCSRMTHNLWLWVILLPKWRVMLPPSALHSEIVHEKAQKCADGTICSCEITDCESFYWQNGGEAQICMPPAQIFATFFWFCAEMWFSCTKMFHGEQKCVYYAQKYFALYTSNILSILRNNIVQHNAQKNISRYVHLIFCAFCVTILYNTMHKKYFALYVSNILYKNISCFIHLIFCTFCRTTLYNASHTKMFRSVRI